MLRGHQKRMLEIAKNPECGVEFSTSIAVVTPGGGKSILPFILGNQLRRRGLIDKILWVVPNRPLVTQAEEDSVDPMTINLTGQKILFEAMRGNSALMYGWPSDCAGIVTTQQAVLCAPHLYEDLVSRARTLVVVDEAHHVIEGGQRGFAFAPVYEKAAYLLLMTGTLQRHIATERILGIEYTDSSDKIAKPDLDPEVQDVIYPRSEALREKAVIPIYYERIDGEVEWEEASTQGRNSAKAETLKGNDANVKRALDASLSGNYAIRLIDRTLEAWQKTKKEPLKNNAKMLVVAPNKKEARRYQKHIKSCGVHALLALSPEDGSSMEMDGDALKAIENFKKPVGTKDSCGVLVSVGMAYEGLNVRSITHISCLTKYRSYPWLEQMIARATRFDPSMGDWEGQAAFIYAPADESFTKILGQIRAEDEAVLRLMKDQDTANKKEEDGEGEGEDVDPNFVTIFAGESDITDIFSEDGQTGEIISGDEWKDINLIKDKLGMSVPDFILRDFVEAWESRKTDVAAEAEAGGESVLNTPSAMEKTISRQRKDHMDRLNDSVQTACAPFYRAATKADHGRIYSAVNQAINERLGAKRADNPTIGLEKLAEAANHFDSAEGAQELHNVARKSIVRKVR